MWGVLLGHRVSRGSSGRGIRTGAGGWGPQQMGLTWVGSLRRAASLGPASGSRYRSNRPGRCPLCLPWSPLVGQVRPGKGSGQWVLAPCCPLG